MVFVIQQQEVKIQEVITVMYNNYNNVLIVHKHTLFLSAYSLSLIRQYPTDV